MANTWTTITFGYVNNHKENTNKISLRDISGIGIKYDPSKGNQTIKIRNIQSMVADSYVGSASQYIAKFSRNTYAIKYDGNGADSGTMENTVHEYHAKASEAGATALRKNAFQKTGYAFKGWYVTRKNGNELQYYCTNSSSSEGWYSEKDMPSGYNKLLFQDGVITCNATTVDEEVLTAVAQWEVKTYTNTIVHLVSGFENGEGNGPTKKYFTIGRIKFTKKYNEKVIYTDNNAIQFPNGCQLRTIFASDVSGSWKLENPMDTSFSQPAINTWTEYYYDPIDYKINYNLNGGTLPKENPSTYNVLYGVDFSNEPARSGYKFLGWYINDKKVTGINVGCNATFASADDLYAKLASRTTGNQTVEAKWEKLTDIAITNTVSGNMGNKSKEFTYTLQLPSSFSGTKLTVVDGSGSTSTVTIGSDCKLSFALKHGQSYTIKELDEAQFNSIKELTNYGILEANYAEEGYKTSFTTKMDAHGNIQLIFNNQNGSVLPTGIILAGSGMGIIVALVIALGWFIKHKFIK